MHFFLVFLGCATQPPAPYTSEECALAYDFEQACYLLNGENSDDEGHPASLPVSTPDVYEIVMRRDALGISKNRNWWCEDPKHHNGYMHQAIFMPPLDSCVTTSKP